jgi:tetratricopeptide (TPR) repeat protein
LSFDSWMGDRAVYCARLESVCAERHPGFESPPIRHAFRPGLTSQWRRGAWRFFCALLLFAFLASGAAAETALEISNLLGKAKDNFHQGNFDGALALLDQIEKAKGGSSQSVDLRGCVYLEQGKLDEAKRAFRAASDADASRFPPRLHFADVLMREKKFTEARDAYSDLMEKTDIQMYNEKLRYAILLTYLFEHNEARAQSALERITFPTESPAYYYAQAAWEFAHNRRDDGIKWVKAAHKMFDSKTTAWFAQPLSDCGWHKEKPVLSFP